MNKIKQNLWQILKTTIKNTFNIDINDINLENPPKKEMWDFAFGCFMLSKELKQNPALIAWELQKSIISNSFIKEATTAWPYLNIKLSEKFYSDIFNDYNFIHTNIWENKKVVVDYIGANVWKPLHIGHMCTPNQGQTIINLYKKLWYDVISDSHIGDWGIIFWKLITAYKKWWEEERLKENAVDYLLELYVKITREAEENPQVESDFREEFKKLSIWDDESIKIWESFTKESIKAMNILLQRLWVKPDYNIWESFYEGLGLPKMENYPDLKYPMHSIVEELLEKWIATKNEDGSVWVIFSDESKIPSCMLQKRDGTHGYLASDLAAIKYRITNWNPAKILYFVDVRQSLHLRQAFEIAKLAGWTKVVESLKGKVEKVSLINLDWFNEDLSSEVSCIENTVSSNAKSEAEDAKLINEVELFHAANGFISLKDGAMSSRKWNIIKLDKLLDEAKSRAKNIILAKRDDLEDLELEELSEMIWIWAIKYSYLSKSRTTDVIFDWDEAMTFDWNSGPYLQYAYVRALRVLEKSWKNLEDIKNTKCGYFSNNEEISLFKELLSYNDVLIEAHNSIMIHNLTKYIYDLTKTFSSFYNNCHILSEDNEDIVSFRLKLVYMFSETLKDAFEILAIKLPAKM